MLRDYVQGLNTSILNNSAAYGYSVAITATFGVLNVSLGSPSVFDVFTFLLGAATAFSIIDLAATGGFKKRMLGDPPEVVVLGAAMGFFSMSSGVGAAALLGSVVEADVTWALGSFAASAVYVLVLAVEIMLAARIDPGDVEKRGGPSR